MYTTSNFKNKKALREAVAAGRQIGVFEPGFGRGSEPRNGVTSVEGPWSPAAHSWYATVTLADGVITKVR